MKRTDSDIDILADKLCKCYQYERNQLARCCNQRDNYRVPKLWLGGGREKKRKSVFHQLALFCRRQQIDPVRYLQWCLDIGQVLVAPPPEPNQLLAQKKMGAYR